MEPSLKKYQQRHILGINYISWLKSAEAKATAAGQNSGETHEVGTEGEKQTLLKLSGKRTETNQTLQAFAACFLQEVLHEDNTYDNRC
jgi:hypothetical protein